MSRRKKTGDPKLAVACLRVSTSKQGTETQRADIKRWAQREGVRVVAWHDDVEGGGKSFEKRAGLLAAIADLEVHGAGVLVYAKIDRFTRDPTTDALVRRALDRLAARLAFADGQGEGDDPTSKLVRGILLAVAEFERALIIARIRAGLAVKKRRGEALGASGRCAYGFKPEFQGTKLDKNGVERKVFVLVPNSKEQAVIAEAKALRASGMSIPDIRDALAEGRMLNRAGKPFGRTELHKLLRDDAPEKGGES